MFLQRFNSLPALKQLLLHIDSPQVCVHNKISVVTKCVSHTVFPCLCHTIQINLQSHTKHTKSIATLVVQGL